MATVPPVTQTPADAGSPPSAPAGVSSAPAAPVDPKVKLREAKLESYQQEIQQLEAKRDAEGGLSNAERAKLSKRKAALEQAATGDETPRPHPGPESNEELAELLGMFFGGVVFPLLGVFARRWWQGTIEELTKLEERELGVAFIPWARRMPWLVFTAKWATAPITLIRMVRAKFRTLPGNPAPAPAEVRTAAQPPLRALQ